MSQTALDCWYLTGPTASGKTRAGLALASLLDAEIVSLDSMTVYRGMDIGTAKPTPQEQADVPHHLLDLVDPNHDYSLSDYVDAAHDCIAQIHARGKTALFVGGTPLYLKAMLRGIFQGPPADWEFRKQIQEEVEQVGSAALHERLAQVDPLSAAKLHPNDQRRIIRALEVYRATGQPISHLQTQFDEGLPADQCKVFVLDWPRHTLQHRIDRRVDQMIAAGFVEEVQGLLNQFQQLSRTASQAVGYREIIEHLEGKHDHPETIALIKTHTRQFAKRQETWFRSLSECRRVPQQDNATPEETAKQIIAIAQP